MLLPLLASTDPLVGPGTVGAAPTAPTLGKEVRQSLPPSLVEALDNLQDQIQIEIFDPLLCASSPEQLSQSFERLFRVFVHYYSSSAHILWGYVHGDSHRFFALTIRSYREAESFIDTEGSRWIGQQGVLNTVEGMTNIMRVSKMALRLLERAPSEQPNPADVLRWGTAVIGYGMAFSAVLSAVTALVKGTSRARLENVVILADWSKAFSVQAYHLTKSLGAHRELTPTNPLPESTDEDLVLANAGLDSYADMLREEDRA